MREEEFLEKIKVGYAQEQFKKIEKAYIFAKKAHQGQLRESGEEYIVHPLAVAAILAELNLDSATIIAALLHDVLEDTPVTAEEMKKEFGQEVWSLVNGVTKLDKLKFKTKEEEQAENLRKMFLAMANDIRVIIIKLADRLNNIRTLKYLPIERQMAMAKETMDIYAPLAGRLGISNMKCELEDTCMQYLYPKEYQELAQEIAVKKAKREAGVQKITNELNEKLLELGVNGEVYGRPKHFYSIFKKMTKGNKTIDQIYDLIAIRVLVDTVKDCYAVLGAVHTMWRPIPGRFKDYIAMPKQNMYQSLHTTVLPDFGGTPFEIQIRTYEMHKVAEYGIAAHWKYKEGKTGAVLSNMESKMSWLREVMDLQGEMKDSSEFLQTLKLDLFTDEVFVFTPKGDVFALPLGANGIDFAYHVHSQIGNKCIGVKVNNKIVPLTAPLQNGDIVEVMTSGSAKGPSRDWLKMATTSSAKAKIRQFFKREMKEENIKRGKEILEKEAKRRGYALSDLLRPEWLEYTLQRNTLSSLDDMYAAVGYGGITANHILVRLIDLLKKDMAKNKPELKETHTAKSSSAGGVLIKGYDDILLRLSHCCNPVPGDRIIGYISRGRGVSIHRADCPNMRNVETERIIEASWPEKINQSFVASLQITAGNKPGILAMVTSLISSQHIAITNIMARVDKGESAIINISVEIRNLEDLDSVMKNIRKLEGVKDVFRTTG